VLVNLGLNRGHAKQHAAAERWLRQAVALCEQKLAADHPFTAVARTALAIELIELGRSRDALPLLEAALPILARESPGSEELAATQIALARVYLDTGRPQRALEVGNPALDFYVGFHDVANRGEARLVVARALTAARLDRARAVELATLARADFTEAKAPEQVTAVDRLLAQLRR
jgi:tetratricopeptide (TPR) repeat protein